MPQPAGIILREIGLRSTSLPNIRQQLAEYGIIININFANGEYWLNVERDSWPDAEAIAEAYCARFP